MLCFLSKPSLVKNFDLSSIVAILSRDIHYDKHNFFLLKSAFIARHETRNFKLPWDIFGDYANVMI